jgi:hypothetical protein
LASPQVEHAVRDDHVLHGERLDLAEPELDVGVAALGRVPPGALDHLYPD